MTTTKSILIRMSPELHAKVRAKAARTKKSPEALMRDALEKWAGAEPEVEIPVEREVTSRLKP